MIANLPDHTRIKHLETRDSQDGSSKTMDVLLEIELFHYGKQEAMDLMRLNGLDVHEVSSTIRPTAIKEQYTEPGSDGNQKN